MNDTPPLSSYMSYVISCSCARCNLRSERPVREVIDVHGEIAADEITAAMAAWLGCEKDPEALRSGCELRVVVVPPAKSGEQTVLAPRALRRWKAAVASDRITLAELQEWDLLYAFCRCGHGQWLNHKDLRKQFGSDATLGELRPRLKCRISPSHNEVGFAIKREHR